jgi:hypothetical protein
VELVLLAMMFVGGVCLYLTVKKVLRLIVRVTVAVISLLISVTVAAVGFAAVAALVVAVAMQLLSI